MERVKDLIVKFCNKESDKYEVYEKECFGIIVKSGFMYMEMLCGLTEFLDKEDLNGEELEFSEGMVIEEMGQDVVVYFPRMYYIL